MNIVRSRMAGHSKFEAEGTNLEQLENTIPFITLYSICNSRSTDMILLDLIERSYEKDMRVGYSHGGHGGC